jgi:sarcosine oxidase
MSHDETIHDNHAARPDPGREMHVAIIGAGVIGAMTAWRLARRGIRVTLFEQYAPAHDRGATGGETRIYRTACKEGAAHVPLIRRSHALWRELESETGKTLLTLTGVASIGDPDDAGMRATLATAEQFGLRLEVLDREAAGRRFPQFRLAPGETMYLDPDGGVLRSDVAVLAATDRAVALGVRLRAYTAVESVREEDDAVILRVNGADEVFSHVVAAAGAWSGQVDALAALPLVPKQITLVWFATNEPGRFLIGSSPVMMRAFPGGYFNTFPSIDGNTIKGSCNVGGWPELVSPQSLPRSMTRQDLDNLRRVVAETVPGLRPDPIRIGVFMDAFTPDGEGVLGKLAPRSRVVVATGFSGHGFKFAPAIGEATAQLVADGATSLPVDHIDIKRYLTAPIQKVIS